MSAVDDYAQTRNGKKIPWSIGDNAATDGQYLNIRDPEWEKLHDNPYDWNHLYYLEIGLYTKEQQEELLALILKWNNSKDER